MEPVVDILIHLVVLYFCYVLLCKQSEDEKFEKITKEVNNLRKDYSDFIKSNSKCNLKQDLNCV